ncbi:unnamed protein product [Caenorhabditis nigoni]
MTPHFLFLSILALLGSAEDVEYDPNGINKIFHYLEDHPEHSLSLIIKENQLIVRQNETCLQYDYVYFEWVNPEIPSPFPNMTSSNEFCTVVQCDNVFGPAESVDCSKYF